jgi:photosystem II stability/assembly factor-like uncharacterized protein
MKTKLPLTLVLLVICFLFSTCKKKDKDEDSQPTQQNTNTNTTNPLGVVTTGAVASITHNSALCGGSVTSEGTSLIVAVGVCWATFHDPTTLCPHTNDGAGVGNYQSSITGLQPNTVYYVRSYVSNGNGTSYGNEYSFRTVPAWEATATLSGNYPYLTTCVDSTIFCSLYSSGTIVKSNDHGVSWTFANNGMSSAYNITSLINDGANLYAADAYGGIYRSSDQGANWTVQSNFTGVRILAYSAGILYAGTNNGVYVSSDNGVTWVPKNTGLPITDIGYLAVSGNNIYVSPMNSWENIYVSPDNGATWSIYTNQFFSQGVYSILVSGSKVYVTSDNGVKSSNDNGVTWVDYPNFSNLLAIRGNKVFASGNNLSLFYISSDNGSTFTTYSSGSSSDYALSAASNGKYVFAATYGGVKRLLLQ